MSKQALKISDFSGGLNSFSDSKDIQNNEFQALDNAEVDENGIIRVSGGVSRDVVLNNISTDSFRLSSIFNPGTGLYSFFSDYSSMLSTYSSDIYDYDLDTLSFDTSWTLTAGDGVGWKVSDNVSPLSQTIGVPRSYVSGIESIAMVDGNDGTPSSLGSIKTSPILLKANSEYTLKFKTMCAGSDSWFYSGLSIPPHIKIHDISDQSNHLTYFSNDGSGYVQSTSDVTATNFLTSEQANMFVTSVGGWTIIGGSSITAGNIANNVTDGTNGSPEIKEYSGSSNGVKCIYVLSDATYIKPSYLSTTDINFGVKSPDISGTDTVNGFIAGASYYLDVMCINPTTNAGDPVVEIRWKDGSDYKVIYSRVFPQRTEWTHINMNDYHNVGNILAPSNDMSFKSIEFKLPSNFDTANDKIQIRVGSNGSGTKSYWTGFNLRRAMIELGNDVKVFGHNSEFLSYPVSYNMTTNSLLFSSGTHFETTLPREYTYKFTTNNVASEIIDGDKYVKLRFEIVAGKWGSRTTYSNLEFYISDLSVIGIGGTNHTLALSEHHPTANQTDLALSYYSKNGYNQTDKSLFPLKYSGIAFANFNYVNGRLLISDGNHQNNNKSYQYYYNKYADKFLLSKTLTSPPRIFNVSVGTYTPYASNERYDVLQKYIGASSNNDAKINLYASDTCENNSWGVIGGNENGQAKSTNQVDMLSGSRYLFNTTADLDNGGGGGAKKRIIINQDEITGKTDDIANIYVKLKVYALVGTARERIFSNNYWNGYIDAATPWYHNEKVKMDMSISQFSDSDYTVDTDTDPHDIANNASPPITAVTTEDLDTLEMGIATNEANSINGWYTEMDINTSFQDGMGGLAGPIGNEAQDGYPRKYISCIVEKNIPFADAQVDKDNNIMIEINVDVDNMADLDHASLGNKNYDPSGMTPGEPTENYFGHYTVEPYTLASGFSALHIDILECDMEFHSGTTINGDNVSKDDVGLSFNFADVTSEHTAEGWEGTWTAAVTTVNVHNEESFLRKVDFNEIVCSNSVHAPEISLVHSSSLDISEIKYFKVYMSYSDSDIYYLQMTCDIQNKKVWSSTSGKKLHANFVSDNNHATWLYQTPSKENLNPNEVYSYESETQVSQEDAESEETMTAQYNCSVVANNHLYVGNIKQNGLIRSDTMIKSPEGRPGILPASNDITLVSNDGDEIIDLHFFKNKLLQFKKNRIYVIGTDEGDYLDEIFENVGIEHKSQVVSTQVGIFWVNESGCYGYNGEGLTNFTEGKIAKKKWKNSISNWLLYENLKPSIGYLRKENKIIIWPSTYNNFLTSNMYPIDYTDGLNKAEQDNAKRISTNEYGYLFDLDGKRWSMIYKGVDGQILNENLETGVNFETTRMYGIGEDSYNSPVTNFAYDIHDNLIWGTPNQEGFKIYKWEDAPSTTSGIGNNERDFRVITKDFDFDAPSIKKKIFKVYVTFKSSLFEADFSNRKELTKPFYSVPNVKAYYSINGTNNWVEFSTTKSKNYDSNGFSLPNTETTLAAGFSNSLTTISKVSFADSSIIKAGNILKIGEEYMLITEITSSAVKLERGYNNTQAVTHTIGETVEVSAGGDWVEASLKPQGSINNINSIAFKFATNTDSNKPVPRGFLINDITVLYRTKRVI